MRTILDRRFALFAMLVASVFAAASAAADQVYQLTLGAWGRSDGIEADVPFVGKALGNCDFLVQGQNNERTKFDVLGTPKNHPGFMVEMAVRYGCLSGMGNKITATAPGVGGALTIPPLFLSRPALGYLVAVPIPDNPNLVQAATSGLWQVPYATRGMGADALGMMTADAAMNIGGTMRMPVNCAEASCTNLPPFRRLHKKAWDGGPAMTFPGQTGRVGSDFTWCWGDPGCTTITQPVYRQILRYKAGPNAFGGTMNQIVFTGIVGSLAIALPTKLVFNILDAGSGAIQVEGRGYADFITDYLPPATKAYMSFMVMDVYQMALGKAVQLITSVMGFATPAPFNAPQLNLKYGFPLTTGTIIVRRTSAVGNPVVTITAMGFDCVNATGVNCSNVTGMGARNISLVTGSLSQLSLLGTRTVGMGHLYLPEPSGSGPLLAGAAALFAVAAWRSRRGGRAQTRRGSRP